MTNRKSYHRIQWYHCGPCKVTPNKGFGPPIWGNRLYLEVNGVRKVKSNAQVTMKKLTPRAEIFSLGVDGQNSAPTQIFFQTSGIVGNEWS